MKPLGSGPKILFRSKHYSVTPTNITLLDQVLLGGFQRGCIIHFYGDPGSGKTTFAMQIMVNILKQKWRGLWIDCNGTFSVQRFASMLGDQRDLLKEFKWARITSFDHQTKMIQNIKHVLDRVGIIVIDPITYFYRKERFKEGSQGFFRELVDTQLSTLVGIAEFQKIPIIVVNYGTVNQQETRVPLVERGFERVERYRLCFKKDATIEDNPDFEVSIERAPEGILRGRVLTFRISRRGIEQVEVKKREVNVD